MSNQNSNKIQLKKCNEMLILLDKLSNCVFNAKIGGIGAIIENRRLGIETPVKINFLKDDKGNNVSIDPFDKLIFSGAVSEIASGNNTVSLSRLFHTIGGGRDLRDAPNIKNAIEQSLSKLRRTEITVDVTALANQFKQYAEQIDTVPDSKGKIILKGTLLPSEIICAVVNGKVTDGAVILFGNPVLLRIAEMKGQITRCNLNLLAVPVRTTEQTLKLKYYLLEHILKIKGSHDPKRSKRVRKLNTSILFDTIFSYCGLPDTKWQKQDFRKSISCILDHFISENFISGYEFVKRENKFYSISITF
jgi:hypothetical protein